MKEAGYDLSKCKVRRLNRQMAKSADKVVLIFSKEKYAGTLPAYFQTLPDVEWWDIPSISDSLPFDEYHRLEKKRIRKIESLVKELVGRIG
jgi:hypothetical protein